jgi:hypothetical protein
LLAGVLRAARERGARIMEAAFIPTARNGMAAGFLPDHGFTAGAGSAFMRELEHLPPVPPWIEIDDARRGD